MICCKLESIYRLNEGGNRGRFSCEANDYLRKRLTGRQVTVSVMGMQKTDPPTRLSQLLYVFM